jgi:hypothetical protein
MSLAKMVRPTIKANFEYPAMPGFEVELTYLTRDELMKIRSKCVTTKIDRKTRQPTDDVDNELFEDIYYKAIVTGWKGLKYKYLPKLGPFVIEETLDPEAEDMYEPEGAVVLMQNSPDFNSWVSDKLEEVGNFTQSS